MIFVVILCSVVDGKHVQCETGEITCSSLVGKGPSASALKSTEVTGLAVDEDSVAGSKSWSNWMFGDRSQDDTPDSTTLAEVCIPVEWVCDGRKDCPDKEDESFCEENEPTNMNDDGSFLDKNSLTSIPHPDELVHL